MEYHSVDLLSSTDSSIDSIDDSFLSGNSYNSYNILYTYNIFLLIILSFLGNSFLDNSLYVSYDFFI